MSCSSIKDIGVLLAGFAAGLLVSRLPHAAAASAPVAADPSQKKLKVSIDEIHQNSVFGDVFVGHYGKAVTMSDGSIRRIELTPMFHEGRQVVEFRDNRGVQYMGLNGTTTDGTLMVQIRDVDAMVALAKADGWPSPSSAAFRIMPALPVSVAFQRIRSRIRGNDGPERVRGATEFVCRCLWLGQVCRDTVDFRASTCKLDLEGIRVLEESSASFERAGPGTSAP